MPYSKDFETMLGVGCTSMHFSISFFRIKKSNFLKILSITNQYWRWSFRDLEFGCLLYLSMMIVW